MGNTPGSHLGYIEAGSFGRNQLAGISSSWVGWGMSSGLNATANSANANANTLGAAIGGYYKQGCTIDRLAVRTGTAFAPGGGTHTIKIGFYDSFYDPQFGFPSPGALLSQWNFDISALGTSAYSSQAASFTFKPDSLYWVTTVYDVVGGAASTTVTTNGSVPSGDLAGSAFTLATGKIFQVNSTFPSGGNDPSLASATVWQRIPSVGYTPAVNPYVQGGNLPATFQPIDWSQAAMSPIGADQRIWMRAVGF